MNTVPDAPGEADDEGYTDEAAHHQHGEEASVDRFPDGLQGDTFRGAGNGPATVGDQDVDSPQGGARRLDEGARAIGCAHVRHDGGGEWPDGLRASDP